MGVQGKVYPVLSGPSCVPYCSVDDVQLSIIVSVYSTSQCVNPLLGQQPESAVDCCTPLFTQRPTVWEIHRDIVSRKEEGRQDRKTRGPICASEGRVRWLSVLNASFSVRTRFPI